MRRITSSHVPSNLIFRNNLSLAANANWILGFDANWRGVPWRTFGITRLSLYFYTHTGFVFPLWCFSKNKIYFQTQFLTFHSDDSAKGGGGGGGGGGLSLSIQGVGRTPTAGHLMLSVGNERGLCTSGTLKNIKIWMQWRKLLFVHLEIYMLYVNIYIDIDIYTYIHVYISISIYI